MVAFNHGAKLWKAGKAADAARFASSSCEYAEAALRLSEESSEDASDTDLVAIKAVREQLSKRYELLAACHQKCGDTKVRYGLFSVDVAINLTPLRRLAMPSQQRLRVSPPVSWRPFPNHSLRYH